MLMRYNSVIQSNYLIIIYAIANETHVHANQTHIWEQTATCIYIHAHTHIYKRTTCVHISSLFVSPHVTKLVVM